MHVIAAKAVCFQEAAKPAFHDYQKQVVANSKALAQSLSEFGYHLQDTLFQLIPRKGKGETYKVLENSR